MIKGTVGLKPSTIACNSRYNIILKVRLYVLKCSKTRKQLAVVILVSSNFARLGFATLRWVVISFTSIVTLNQ